MFIVYDSTFILVGPCNETFAVTGNKPSGKCQGNETERGNVIH